VKVLFAGGARKPAAEYRNFMKLFCN